MSLTTPTFAKLNGSNYVTWSGNMKAYLRLTGVWRIVNKENTKPTCSSPPTQDELTRQEAWLEKLEKAAGVIYTMVEDDQKVHFSGIDDDPIKMWEKAKEVHMQQKPGTCFNAYNDVILGLLQSA